MAENSINTSPHDQALDQEYAVFDRADLLMRMMNNENLVNVFIEAFMTEASSLIQDIERAGADNDQEALTMAAHSFKGASANVSALQLALISGKIEALSRDDDLETAKKLIPQLKPSYEKLKEIIGV